ncbi:MAG: hypothetical protein COC19_06355 [SAR86 cluster bacterium]|uniref:CopC domain-containing protein n=1 Tax=SAR86 cluster bacterium TaxID=2030880 RepID=A0A2A4MKD1_9GAMM|nr:MAG: hypothetical protein COC19_06355 [SAR86 cluster bacterium]
MSASHTKQPRLALWIISKAILLSFLLSNQCFAQHSHGVLTPGVTFPQDDAILIDPPRMITMSFRVDVTLLKLALYTADQKWINIGFKFEPERLDHNFIFPLPENLPASQYYIAKWTVIDDRRIAVNGEFKFAYGDDAIAPSETIAAQASGKVEMLPSTGSYRRTSRSD